MNKIINAAVCFVLLFLMSSCSLAADKRNDQNIMTYVKTADLYDELINDGLNLKAEYYDGRSGKVSFVDDVMLQATYDETGRMEYCLIKDEETVDIYEDGAFSRIIDYSQDHRLDAVFDKEIMNLKKTLSQGKTTTFIYEVKTNSIHEHLQKYGISEEGVKSVEVSLVYDEEVPVKLSEKVDYESSDDLILMEAEISAEPAAVEDVFLLFEDHFRQTEANDLTVVAQPGSSSEKRNIYKIFKGDSYDVIARPGYNIYHNSEKNTYYLIQGGEYDEESGEMLPSELDSSDFVNLSEVIPDAILEIRYYTDFNFMGVRANGYEQPVALLTKEAAEALKGVADELREKGYLLKIYDAYRPASAEDHFYEWSLDLSDTKMKDYFYPYIGKDQLFAQGYVAKRSSHPRGSCLDMSLFDMKKGRDVDMGTGFDFFDQSSHPDFTGISDEQYANRMLLKNAMIAHGFRPFYGEWWHFILNDEPYPDTYFNFPNSLDSLID